MRRAVIDGVEPAGRHSESIQFELFDYVYHQILWKEADWVACDLFRQRYREFANAVEKHKYDHEQIGCLLLYTSAETMLDELIRRPLDEGDVLANASTIIHLGKVMEGGKIRRALHIAKHRAALPAIKPCRSKSPITACGWYKPPSRRYYISLRCPSTCPGIPFALFC